MRFREDIRANNQHFRQSIKAGNEQFKKDLDEVGTPKSTRKGRSDRWRSVPTWRIVTILVVFFPAGLYLLWRQDRWSKGRKKTVTGALSLAVVLCFALLAIVAPPTVTVTSSLAAVNADSYRLAGNISPSGSLVTINGIPAQVSGDTFSSMVPLKEGDNNLKVVVFSGSKRAEQIFKIHRYTKAEVMAQQKAATEKAAAKARADAAAEQAKQQQAAAAKAQADADAAANAAQQKAAADAAAKAQADAAAAAAVTVSQKNAVSKAKDYLGFTAFSHDGLVDQLVYDQFSVADATYGADHSGADWNAEAAQKAKDYMSYSSFSRGGLIDQLEYDKFTPDQAAYGADSVGL